MAHRTSVLALPCDYGAVHHYLTREIDFHVLDYTHLLSRARHLLSLHAPDRVDPNTYRQLASARSSVTAYPWEWHLTRVTHVTRGVNDTTLSTHRTTRALDPRWVVMFVLELMLYSSLIGYMYAQ
jgi:hypothetical protein